MGMYSSYVYTNDNKEFLQSHLKPVAALVKSQPTIR